MTANLGFPAMRGEILGITAYRGLAKLADIGRISAADVFDQRSNPTGTQRDLNINHAKQAYEYVVSTGLAFWPEVVLCCRQGKVLSFQETDKGVGSGILTVDLKVIQALAAKGKIAISRLDGNHRLHFAIGDEQSMSPIERQASFCILVGLRPEEEIKLFRDINNNQRRMNTSHLDSIVTRLTPEQELMIEDPALYIAKRLGDDPESPLFDHVYEGGKKPEGFSVPLRTLHTGISYLMQRSMKLGQLNDMEAEYLFIRNYWQALKQWVPRAWEDPKQYLLMRGAGLWGACMLGGIVIDRCLERGQYSIKAILEILRSGGEWDWSRGGQFKGYSGRGGALEIASIVSREFATESGVSIKKIAEKIKAA